MNFLTVLELCAGAGGQAIGLERAGFRHIAAVEIDADACATLRLNRSDWQVHEQDLRAFNPRAYHGVDLVAGGVPCPPFSIAGHQLGADDARDLFPEALRIVDALRPRAVLLENVPGFGSAKFTTYREHILMRLDGMGYRCFTRQCQAAEFGVAQLRPRFVLVAVQGEHARSFAWPMVQQQRVTVADSIGDLMGAAGWKGVDRWRKSANDIGPTLVGGSKSTAARTWGPPARATNGRSWA